MSASVQALAVPEVVYPVPMSSGTASRPIAGETNVVADFPVRLTAALHVEVVTNQVMRGDVITLGAPFSIRVGWALPANHDAPRSGQYGVSVVAQAIGPGYEGPLGRGEPVPASQAGDEPHVATIDVPATVLGPGVYRIVTMLSHEDPARGVATVVGFREGPCVEVREPCPPGASMAAAGGPERLAGRESGC